MPQYIGNGPYCYSNSTAMLLESIGEHVEPRLIEVLSGVGLGAFMFKDQGLLFLSGLVSTPDNGISSSLRLLGFQFSEESETNDTVIPIQSLTQIVKDNRIQLANNLKLLSDIEYELNISY